MEEVSEYKGESGYSAEKESEEKIVKELIKIITSDDQLFSLFVFMGGFGLIGILGLIAWLIEVL